MQPPSSRSALGRRDEHAVAVALLVATAIAYTVAMIVFVVPHTPLGADESIYASQVNPRVPALVFSAPRARGITYLIAPLVHLTGSTEAMRLYLAIIAGALLVAAYWPWLRLVRRPRIVPLAAFLFACLWTALVYGAADMPNAWVALLAVAAVGWFLRYGPQCRRALIGVVLALAGITLMRPSDAVWIALPLLVVAAIRAALGTQRRWVAITLAAGVAVGVAAGGAQWVIEAEDRFGGVATRLHLASLRQGGLGWHPIATLYELRSLSGPQLCRPCTVGAAQLSSPLTILLGAWWVAIPVVVAVAFVLARREGTVAIVAVPAACAATIGLSYLLSVDYAAPRFLLPTYALASLPAAFALDGIARRVPGRVRRPALAVIAAAVVANLVVQGVALQRQSDVPYPATAAAISLSRMDVDGTCVISGEHAAQIAYRLGCTTAPLRRIGRLARRADVAYLTAGQAPSALAAWQRHALPHPGDTSAWYAYLPPSTATSP